METAGDVAARVRVRMEGGPDQSRADGSVARRDARGGDRRADADAPTRAVGLGLVEGWRGEMLCFVRFGAHGRIARFFPRDPSWFTWPALERLIHGNIVPDFPGLQQIGQRLLFGPGPLGVAMFRILKQSLRTGIDHRAGARMPTTRNWSGLGIELRRQIDARFARSLAIRQVDAGSCNGCELEIHALNNAYYDVERFGVHFVASPRHADALLVTGPVSRHMEDGAAPYLARHALAEARHRGRHLCLHGGEFGDLLRELRGGGERDPRRCEDPRLPSGAPGPTAGFARGHLARRSVHFRRSIACAPATPTVTQGPAGTGAGPGAGRRPMMAVPMPPSSPSDRWFAPSQDAKQDIDALTEQFHAYFTKLGDFR